MTTWLKAQANTSRPEEGRLRLPDPGHNLPRDGEPLAFSSLSFLLAYLALALVTLPLFFFSRLSVKTVDFSFSNELDPPRFDQ